MPRGTVRAGEPDPEASTFYAPWYAGRFDGVEGVASHWRERYGCLRAASAAFRDCFYDTTLPAEVVESVAENLSILKSPTCLRQTDGRFWGWEGCAGEAGCCAGTCTHVWNYAQALPHLFPELERTLRETEFGQNQDERGHQNFRAPLPIRPADHGFHAAADGQLGGLMKLYREWRIGGDTEWLRSLMPAAKSSLDYCIATWDPNHTGTLVEPHHNTYDIEFWGADGMCTSFYLGALAAVIAMGRALDMDVSGYEALLERGRQAMGTTLWNGDWFIQKVQWRGLRAGDPVTNPARINSMGYTPEAIAILQREGPKYQYGTGIEYQVASHLIMTGRIEEGLTILRAIRQRYDGRWRNPFDKYECGHWYARSMASYGLLQAFSGARYDAVERTLYLHPAAGGDFRAFLCTATGYGTVGVRDGKPFLEVKSGTIPVNRIDT